MFHFRRVLCSNLSFRHLSSTKCWEGAKLVLNARCQSIQFQALAFTPPSLSLSHPGKIISLTLGGEGLEKKKSASHTLWGCGEDPETPCGRIWPSIILLSVSCVTHTPLAGLRSCTQVWSVCFLTIVARLSGCHREKTVRHRGAEPVTLTSTTRVQHQDQLGYKRQVSYEEL